MHKILIAEDNPADVSLLRETLDSMGLAYTVTLVETGDEFLEYIADSCDEKELDKPDLIVIDWSLPRSTGPELIADIRKSKRCADAPIFVLTNSVSPHDQALALKAGANLFLSKPVFLEQYAEIGRLIRKQLEGTEAAAE